MKENRVLFVSIHPDDETLGCGGNILKHRDAGDRIYWLNLTGPSRDYPSVFPDYIFDIRERQLQAVVAAYGFEELINLNHPAQFLHSVEPRLLIGGIHETLQRIRPDIIYTTNRSDVHSDHKVGFQAIYGATKNFRCPFIKKILMYETLSETEFAPALPESVFNPNVFCDISNYMDDKLKIMQMYDTETMPDPYPRSNHAIIGLASFRGSRIGVKYAEAFSLLLEIN